MELNKSSGQISRTLIILAAVMLVVIVIAYFVIRITASRTPANQETGTQAENEPPKPVYETIIGETRFLFESAVDLGSVLRSNTTFQQDLETTERFIRVVISAQNKGKNNIQQFSWDLGNIIDSEGRNFVPITNEAYFFLPKPDLCGSILKPEFDPVPCTRIYEVSKASKDLKIEVSADVSASGSGVGPGAGSKQKALLDLDVK